MSALPRGWVETTLGEVFTLVRGLTYSKEDVSDEPGDGFVALLRANNIQQGQIDLDDVIYLPVSIVKDDQILRAGDIVLATSSGSRTVVGKAARITSGAEGSTFGAFCGVARPNLPDVDKLLFQYMRSRAYREYVEAVAIGTNINNFRTSDIQGMAIPLPPLAEQKRIVAKLDALNAKSARARIELARIETLVSRYKQAVLSKAFSSVDAERISLLNLTDFVTSGSRGWAKFYSDEGPLFIRIGNTVRGTIVPDLDDIQRVSPPEGAEGVRTRVQPNDIVVTITADLGRIALIDEQMGEAYVNQHLALVRLLNPDSAAFFAWYLVSDEGQAQLHRNNRGATRSGLGLDDIRQVEMPTPPLDVQHEIVRRIESAFARMDRLAKEAKRALELVGRLDEAFLTKAFRGELVPQDERDEPASSVLDRIREVRMGEPSRPKRRTSAKKGKVHDMARTIIEALAEAKDWLAAQELFARCGVRDGSSTEDVEKLYRQLLDLERQDKVEIEELSDPMTGAKQGNRIRLRK